MKNNKLIWLTSNKKAKHLPNAISSKYMYFTSNSRSKRKFDLYRRKLPLTKTNAPPERLYTPREGVARAALVFHDDSHIILEQHYSNVHNELILLNTRSKKLTYLTRNLTNQKIARWQAMKFLNRKHSRILVKTDFESEFNRLAILEFPNGDLTQTPKFIPIPQMEQLKHDVSGITSNYKTGYSYIEINEDGYSTLLRAKITPNGINEPMVRMKLPLKNAVIAHGDARSFGHGLTISHNGQFAAMTITNSETPSAIWIMELTGDHKSWPLLPNDLPQSVKKAQFVGETLEHFDSFDGLRVPYFLFVPRGPVPVGGWPAVVRLHGGPESQTRPIFDALTQVLVRAGFAVAAPNIRGSRGYGKTYLNMDNREKRMDAIRDIKELALALPKTKYQMNGKKLVVMGGSYGGYATLMSVVSFPEVWKAGVDVVGMSNLVTFFKHTAEWRRKLRAEEYGDYHTQLDLLKRISPINYVENVRCPVFIIQGSNDERVPVSEAVQIYKKLKQVGTEPGKQQVANSKLMVFKDEGHGLSKLKNRLVAYHALLRWLRKTVQDA